MISLTCAIYSIMEMCKSFTEIKRIIPTLDNLIILYESNSYIIIDKFPVSTYIYILQYKF